MDRRARTWLLWIGAAFLALFVANTLLHANQQPLDYSRFVSLVEQHAIVGTLEISDTNISGTYKSSAGEVAFITGAARGQGRSRLTGA